MEPRYFSDPSLPATREDFEALVQRYDDELRDIPVHLRAGQIVSLVFRATRVYDAFLDKNDKMRRREPPMDSNAFYEKVAEWYAAVYGDRAEVRWNSIGSVAIGIGRTPWQVQIPLCFGAAVPWILSTKPRPSGHPYVVNVIEQIVDMTPTRAQLLTHKDIENLLHGFAWAAHFIIDLEMLQRSLPDGTPRQLVAAARIDLERAVDLLIEPPDGNYSRSQNHSSEHAEKLIKASLEFLHPNMTKRNHGVEQRAIELELPSDDIQRAKEVQWGSGARYNETVATDVDDALSRHWKSMRIGSNAVRRIIPNLIDGLQEGRSEDFNAGMRLYSLAPIEAVHVDTD